LTVSHQAARAAPEPRAQIVFALVVAAEVAAQERVPDVMDVLARPDRE